ncbi:MAG: tetratricopeptide repeat protein [Alphaproteobacteria bacterium]
MRSRLRNLSIGALVGQYLHPAIERRIPPLRQSHGRASSDAVGTARPDDLSKVGIALALASIFLLGLAPNSARAGCISGQACPTCPPQPCMGDWNPPTRGGNDGWTQFYEPTPRDTAQPHFNNGYATMQQQRYAEAEFFFREAVRLDPSFGAAWTNLGYVLEQMGRYSEALEAYRVAHERSDEIGSKNYRNLWDWMARQETARRERAEAERRAAEQRETEARERAQAIRQTTERGRERLSRGMVEEAIVDFEKILIVDPGNAEARAFLDYAKARRTAQIRDATQPVEDVLLPPPTDPSAIMDRLSHVGDQLRAQFSGAGGGAWGQAYLTQGQSIATAGKSSKEGATSQAGDPFIFNPGAGERFPAIVGNDNIPPQAGAMRDGPITKPTHAPEASREDRPDAAGSLAEFNRAHGGFLKKEETLLAEIAASKTAAASAPPAAQKKEAAKQQKLVEQVNIVRAEAIESTVNLAFRPKRSSEPPPPRIPAGSRE